MNFIEDIKKALFEESKKYSSAQERNLNNLLVSISNKENQWRPFKTAPKDREILVCYPNQNNVVVLVRWNNHRQYWTMKGEPNLGIEKQDCYWADIPLFNLSTTNK